MSKCYDVEDTLDAAQDVIRAALDRLSDEWEIVTGQIAELAEKQRALHDQMVEVDSALTVVIRLRREGNPPDTLR